MVFGQLLPGATRMIGALVVLLPVPLVQQTIYSSDEFTRSLATFATKHQIAPTLRSPDPDKFPIERVVVERASLVAITFGEDDAELRFYRVSPSDMRALSQDGEKVDVVYPVVQVMLDTSELVHLIHSLAKLVPQGSK